MKTRRFRTLCICILLGTTLLTAAPTVVFSQTLATIKTPGGPLKLKSRGSFVVGGGIVRQTPTQLSSIWGTPPTNAGDITIDQMYVEFMVPERETGVPVVMLHGATLSGKTYDTTPDGRMGWYEYFVRRGHPVYVPDQVSRGRSGVDVAVYNDVRAGKRPASDLPNAFRISAQLGWTMFRLGPSYGTAFPDQQFPTQAAAELARQAVPDLNATLPTPNPNVRAMADLAEQLKGAVLMGHSETGALPLDAALTRPEGIKAVILVEPGGCQADTWSNEQIARFARLPILALFGDHLDVPTGSPGFSWNDAYTDCQKFTTRVRAAGGKAEMLYLPEKRIFGNSHVMMMDKNNLQIADLLLQWVQRNTARK